MWEDTVYHGRALKWIDKMEKFGRSEWQADEYNFILFFLQKSVMCCILVILQTFF